MWLDNLIGEFDAEQRLRSDLEYFAAKRLRLRTKAGAIAPLVSMLRKRIFMRSWKSKRNAAAEFGHCF